MKQKKLIFALGIFLLIGIIIFVHAQEEDPDFIKLAQEDGLNTHQIKDAWIIGEFDTDEYGNIEFTDNGKVSIKDDQGNLLNSFENIASKGPNGETCKININDNNANEIISAKLYTSEDTQITLNGKVYDVPKNTEIIYEKGKEPVINHGDNRYTLEEDKGISFKESSNGEYVIESDSNIDISRSYSSQEDEASLGENIERINKNKKQEIRINEKGQIVSIKNAKIGYSDNLFLKSGEDTETYIYRNTKCNSMHENFICLDERTIKNKIRLKGDSEFIINGKNNIYLSGDEGYLRLKTNKDSELEFSLKEDTQETIKNQAEIKGNGIIQNGKKNLRINNKGYLSIIKTHSLQGEIVPMELIPRNENNNLGDIKAIITKNKEKKYDLVDITFMERLGDSPSRIFVQEEAEAEPTKEPDEEPDEEPSTGIPGGGDGKPSNPYSPGNPYSYNKKAEEKEKNWDEADDYPRP